MTHHLNKYLNSEKSDQAPLSCKQNFSQSSYMYSIFAHIREEQGAKNPLSSPTSMYCIFENKQFIQGKLEFQIMFSAKRSFETNYYFDVAAYLNLQIKSSMTTNFWSSVHLQYMYGHWPRKQIYSMNENEDKIYNW